MFQPVRAVLVGAGGFAGGWVVPMLARLDGLDYVAVVDPDAAAARRAAEALGAETVTADLDGVLARDDVEMVDLQTPNYLHASQAEAAFAAGKHVFCQKPMAPSLAQGRRMVRAARHAGRRLGIFMDDLNDPILVDMKAAIEAGFVGRPTAFHFAFGRPGWKGLEPGSWRTSLAKTGGGCFIQLAIHNVRMLAWLFDSPVRRVTGFMKTLLAQMGGDDSAAAALELGNGLVGTAGASYILVSRAELSTQLTAVWGTEGAIRKQRQGGLVVAWSERATFRGEVIRYDTPGEVRTFTRPDTRLHRPTVHEQFAASIRTGEPYAVPGEEGLRDVAVCLALAESSRSGRAIDVDEFLAASP